MAYVHRSCAGMHMHGCRACVALCTKVCDLQYSTCHEGVHRCGLLSGGIHQYLEAAILLYSLCVTLTASAGWSDESNI